jgi:putative ABC transport system permease protein
VLISEALQRLADVEVGERIELATPAGSRSLPVEGVVIDYASDQGTVVMSGTLFASLWRDTRVNRFHVHLEQGAAVEEMRARIYEALGRPVDLKFLRLGELVEYHDRLLSNAFGAARVLELLIVVVTLAGVAEALLTSVEYRRREFALARAAGASVSQIERAVVIEAAIMIGCGLALGMVGGTVSAWLWVRYHFTYLLGWILQFFFPWTATARMMVLAAAVALLAAYLPARRAARTPILQALRYE